MEPPLRSSQQGASSSVSLRTSGSLQQPRPTPVISLAALLVPGRDETSQATGSKPQAPPPRSVLPGKPMPRVSTIEQKQQCLKVLTEMGVPNPDIFLYHLPDSQTGFLIHMYTAGQQYQVPMRWTPEYFTALCNYLDGLYLAAAMLNTFFKYIKKLALALNQDITTYQYAEFDTVLAHAKLPIDNKWPVSQECLQELCAAADVLFEEYAATLAKVMMMTAWACFMRVSEYTNSKAYKDHNVEVHAVDITDDGIGIIFESDKTSKVSGNSKTLEGCLEGFTAASEL